MAYLLGTFTLNWWSVENLAFLYVSIHLFYLRTVFGKSLTSYRHLSWLWHFMVLAYLANFALNNKTTSDDPKGSGPWY